MANFAFKQGLVVPERTWRCTPEGVEGPDGEAVSFAIVTHGHFAYVGGRPSVAQFALLGPESEISVQCNAHVGSDSHRVFAAFVWTALEGLDRVNPSVIFTPPPNENRIRRVGQAVGVLGLLYGVYFIVVNGVLADEAVGLGYGFGVGIIVMSLFWMWATAPVSVDPKNVQETMQWVRRAYGMHP